MTDVEVLKALDDVVDPEIGKPLAAIKMLKGATVADNGSVEVQIELPTPAYPDRERISGLPICTITLGSPQTAELEWMLRDLGTLEFAVDIPTGKRLANLCRRQWTLDGRKSQE